MQVRARDSTAYHSCDDHILVVDKAIDCGRRGVQSNKRISDFENQGWSSYGIAPLNPQGIGYWLALTANILWFRNKVLRILDLDLLFSDGLSIGSRTITREDSGERFFQWLARVLIAFLMKILSYIHVIGFREGRLSNIHPSDAQNCAAQCSLSMENIEDRLSPCLERLQRLEMMFDELTNKHAEIPFEKERVLLESWDRIKHIEFDLENTKRVRFQFTFICLCNIVTGCLKITIMALVGPSVKFIYFKLSVQVLHATLMKQLDIAESLDAMQDFKLRVNLYGFVVFIYVYFISLKPFRVPTRIVKSTIENDI
ncbi:hypothetical protein B296_00000887 [Ensete ventricosum]|uniref:Uncharacterized protein n=1 Tax=Ensete ventricosum TaxID=4639 RepID=A0A427AVG6_ENSVE|nr:hypothetical protein B296_00000887 [Ensete ventricosum]